MYLNIKYIFFLIFFFSFFICQSQTIENKISIETKQAFELTEKNKRGDAIKLSEKYLNEAQALHNDSLTAFAYNNLGISYSKLGNIEKG